MSRKKKRGRQPGTTEPFDRFAVRRLLAIIELKVRQQLTVRKWLLKLMGSIVILAVFGVALWWVWRPECPYVKTAIGEF